MGSRAELGVTIRPLRGGVQRGLFGGFGERSNRGGRVVAGSMCRVKDARSGSLRGFGEGVRSGAQRATGSMCRVMGAECGLFGDRGKYPEGGAFEPRPAAS